MGEISAFSIFLLPNHSLPHLDFPYDYNIIIIDFYPYNFVKDYCNLLLQGYRHIQVFQDLDM